MPAPGYTVVDVIGDQQISYVSSGEEGDNSTYFGTDPDFHSNGDPTKRIHNYGSINAKPTGATLASTFSDNPQQSYDIADASGHNTLYSDDQYFINTNGLEYVDSEDAEEGDNTVHNSGHHKVVVSQDHLIAGGLEYVDSEEEEYAAAMHDTHHQKETECEGDYYRDMNGLEYADSGSQHGFEYTDGNDTLGYTVNEDGETYLEEETAFGEDEEQYGQHNAPSFSARAVHQRSLGGLFTATPQLEQTESSVGYETYDSKTLNTNREGIIFEPDMETIPDNEPGYSYETSGEDYYGQDDDPSAQLTMARRSQSSMGRSQSIGTAIAKRSTLSAEYEDDTRTGFMTYDSEASGSTWEEGDDATRDISLMDSADSKDLREDETDVFSCDDDDSSDDDSCSSDDDSRDSRRRRGRRRRRPRTMMDLVNHMKKVALTNVKKTLEESEFEFLPDVAQTSTGSSSSRSSGRRNSKGRRRRQAPAVRLVESLVDLFSCGAPSYR